MYRDCTGELIGGPVARNPVFNFAIHLFSSLYFCNPQSSLSLQQLLTIAVQKAQTPQPITVAGVTSLGTGQGPEDGCGEEARKNFMQ